MKLILVTLLCIAFAVIAQLPGFKTTLSKRGIDYARDIGITVLRRELGNLKIPDQSGTAGTPIGKIEWGLSQFQITGINLPNPSINLAPSHLQLIVSPVSVGMNFRWRYKKTSFPKVSDSGSGTCGVGGARLHLNLALVPHNGKIRAQVVGLNFGIGSFDLKLRGGASWLYNILIGLFKGSVRNNIEKEIRSAITKEIDGRLNQELAKIPYIVELKPTGIALDYSMVAVPTYNPNYLTIPGKGEFFDLSNRTRSEYNPIQFPDHLGENKMMHLLLGDYVLKTAAEAFHKKGELKVWLVDKMIPSWSPVRLNSSSFSLLIPNLQRTFPNSELRVHLSTFRNPELDIKDHNATVRVFGELAMWAMDGQGQLKPAFTLQGYVVAAGRVGLRGHNLIGELLFVNQKFQIKETHVGQFSVEMFDDLMNMLFERGIIPALNIYLKEGIRLPTLGDLTLIEPSVRFANGFISIATDVKYNLNTIQTK